MSAVATATLCLLAPVAAVAGPVDFSKGVLKSQGILLVEAKAQAGNARSSTCVVRKVYKGSFVPGQEVQLSRGGAPWAPSRDVVVSVVLGVRSGEAWTYKVTGGVRDDDDTSFTVRPHPVATADTSLNVGVADDVSSIEAIEAGLREALRRAGAYEAALMMKDPENRRRAVLALIPRVPFDPVFFEDYAQNPPDALESEILGSLRFQHQGVAFLEAIVDLTPLQIACLSEPRPELDDLWTLLGIASQPATAVQLRLAAIRWLERCWWSTYENILKAAIPMLLDDPEPLVRAAAAVHLRKRHGAAFPEAREILLSAAHSERDPFVRLVLMQVLIGVDAIDRYARDAREPFVLEAAFRDGKAFWLCAAPNHERPFASGWVFKAYTQSSSAMAPRASRPLEAALEKRDTAMSPLVFEPALEPGEHELWLEAELEAAAGGGATPKISSRRQKLRLAGETK